MIESGFVLRGMLVGIVANLLLIPLAPLMLLTQPTTVQSEPNSQGSILLWVSFAVKILGSTLGAYIGGRRRKKLMSA